MADFAFLNTALYCPSCRQEIADQVWFQWGFCRGRAPDPASSYSLGDAIRWHTCRDGRIPEWTSFVEGSSAAGSNIGTPAVRDVVVRDWGQTWLREGCPNCGVPLGGAAVEIREGRIARGFLTSSDEMDSATYLIPSAGKLKPVPEWENHPLAIERDC
jgi:hypothetical protein